MSELQRRRWTAPDGARLWVSITERVVDDGVSVRRVRRIEFATLDGEAVGDGPVPGYFSLDLAGSFELEEIWRSVVGR